MAWDFFRGGGELLNGWDVRGASQPSALRVGLTTALVWSSSLASFALSTMAAECEGGSSTSAFTVGGCALAAGAVGAGVLSDRVGRRRTARVLFFAGCVAAACASLLQPASGPTLLVLTAVAGVAAGGAHVSAELFLEAVPAARRSLALLAFPALFLPAGAAQAGLRALNWGGAAMLTALLAVAAAVALATLPESVIFEKSRANRLDRSAIGGFMPLSTFGGDGDDGVGDDAFLESGNVGGRGGAGGGVRGAARGLLCGGVSSNASFPHAGPTPVCSGSSSCVRIGALCAALWSLFIGVYWLSSLAVLAISGSFDGRGNGRSDAASFCGISSSRGEIVDVSAGTEFIRGVGGTATPACSEGAGSGQHLLVAELLAIFVVSCTVSASALGRKWTLAAAFGTSSILLGAATSVARAGAGPCGAASAGATALEFFVRLVVAASGAALFLYTLEVSATPHRSTVAGLALGAFRLGALVSLWGGAAVDEGAGGRLQWSVYALRNEASFFGFTRGSAEHASAVTASLTACAQACAAAAVLCAMLPVDTASTELRGGVGDAFELSGLVANPPSLPHGAPAARGGVPSASTAFGRNAHGGHTTRRAAGRGGGRRSTTTSTSLWEPASVLSPLRAQDLVSSSHDLDGNEGGASVGRSRASAARFFFSSLLARARGYGEVDGVGRVGGRGEGGEGRGGSKRSWSRGWGGGTLGRGRTHAVHIEPPLFVERAALGRAVVAFEAQVIPRALRLVSPAAPPPPLRGDEVSAAGGTGLTVNGAVSGESAADLRAAVREVVDAKNGSAARDLAARMDKVRKTMGSGGRSAALEDALDRDGLLLRVLANSWGGAAEIG